MHPAIPMILLQAQKNKAKASIIVELENTIERRNQREMSDERFYYSGLYKQYEASIREISAELRDIENV